MPRDTEYRHIRDGEPETNLAVISRDVEDLKDRVKALEDKEEITGKHELIEARGKIKQYEDERRRNWSDNMRTFGSVIVGAGLAELFHYIMTHGAK